MFFKGYTLEQLIEFWKEEAIFALSGIKSGALKGVPYKVVAARKVRACACEHANCVGPHRVYRVYRVKVSTALLVGDRTHSDTEKEE